MIPIIITLVVFSIMIPIVILSKKYTNPYRLYMVFGKKGSGKTTYLVRTAIRYLKKGYTVYTTEHINPYNPSPRPRPRLLSRIPHPPFPRWLERLVARTPRMGVRKPRKRLLSSGATHGRAVPWQNLKYVADIQKLGNYVPSPKSVLLIDEVGMIWDNRNYKAFREDVRDFFKLQRHYECIVYLFSQSFDIDLKLRTLTDAMYLCTTPLPFLSVVRRIKRTIVLVQPNNESEGRIADSLEFVSPLLNLFGAHSLQLTYIPKYAKYFDTKSAPQLPYL